MRKVPKNNSKSTPAAVREYLALIGRKGGKKSRRTLTSETAKSMVQLREARRAFRKYYAKCFWWCDPMLIIQTKDIRWVGEQLLKNGGMDVWNLGRRFCL